MAKSTQGERIARLEAIMHEVKAALARIELKVDSARASDDEEFKAIHKQIENKLIEREKMYDDKYAPIWVKNVLMWAGSFLSTIVAGIIIKLVWWI